MKKVFSKIMLIVFSVSLGLFVVLGVVTIVLGPQKTEDSIKALFNLENFKQKYKKFIPFAQKRFYYSSSTPSEVLGVSSVIKDRTDEPPLLVPSNGIAPSADFLFSGRLSEGKHEGIDIWTDRAGYGMDHKTYSKGNPVYSACNGYVDEVWIENGDVFIMCDPIDEIYQDKLPSLRVMTAYGHMADQWSQEDYIYVAEGERVEKGQLIGHQGNRCYWSPRNRIVHLHFGVYDVTGTGYYTPIDPEPYIGVSCTTLNQVFEVDKDLILTDK